MNILGVHEGHDSSICLLRNGRVEKYFLNERISGIKHDRELPYDQMNEIVKSYNIDAVAVSVNWECDSKNTKFISELNIPQVKYDYSKKHHVGHASLAYHNSGFDESLIFVIDGSGSVFVDEIGNSLGECESVFEYNKNRKKLLYKKVRQVGTHVTDQFIPSLSEYDHKNSNGIGTLYDSAAVVTGNSVNECGKAMGLSSYGDDNENFKNMFVYENILNNDFFQKDNIKSFLLNPVDKITPYNYKKYADYCYAVQKQSQVATGDLIEKWVKETDITNVCLSGGYAMNVVTNYYLLKRFPYLNFYFEPICSDKGLSIGVAMDLYQRLRKRHHPKVKKNKTTAFHGELYKIPKEGKKTNLKAISKLLFCNNSVGIFNEKAEAGQRALGNRSILFNALNPNAKEIVNQIKRREWYRPFAAIVLEEDAHNYFDVSLMPSSPFMTVAFPVITDIIPGVTHVDNTCRIQTVNKRDGYLYKLLKEFKKMSGHGILLNTSMNLAGHPLVETPKHAINTMNQSKLDYLYFPGANQLFTNDARYDKIDNYDINTL